MFTGIIEDKGIIVSKKDSTISIKTTLQQVKPGDSIAVNGICLTAVNVHREGAIIVILFDYSPETAAKTDLGGATAGSYVNLERALKVGDALGGHFITGHIEGIGTLVEKTPRGNFIEMRFSIPTDLTKYVVHKGSIGIDGISLTVSAIKENIVSVSVIPFTLNATTLNCKHIGDLVNIETDLLAKYVENMSAPRDRSQNITEQFLKDNGF